MPKNCKTFIKSPVQTLDHFRIKSVYCFTNSNKLNCSFKLFWERELGFHFISGPCLHTGIISPLAQVKLFEKCFKMRKSTKMHTFIWRVLDILAHHSDASWFSRYFVTYGLNSSLLVAYFRDIPKVIKPLTLWTSYVQVSEIQMILQHIQ